MKGFATSIDLQSVSFEAKLMQLVASHMDGSRGDAMPRGKGIRSLILKEALDEFWLLLGGWLFTYPSIQPCYKMLQAMPVPGST